MTKLDNLKRKREEAKLMQRVYADRVRQLDSEIAAEEFKTKTLSSPKTQETSENH